MRVEPLRALHTCNPGCHTRANSPYTPPMDAMDDVIASMSPDDTAAALRLLNLLEEWGMTATEAREPTKSPQY